MTPAVTYDLFVSYADADRAWVEGYLLDALRAAGVRCHSEAAFTLGTPRLLAFERAVQQSHRVLLVLSPAYLADGFMQFTDLLAQSYGLEASAWPVIPLVLHPVTMPPRLRMLTALDATNPASWQGVVGRLCGEMRRAGPGPAPRPPCPYPGMIPFRARDAHLFFGRDAEVKQMLQHLRHQRLLFVIGPSGSGKSSLVRAGLLPQLTRGSAFPQGFWLLRQIRPGLQPLAAMTQALAGDPANSVQAVTELLATRSPAQRLLLIVDQFEELFSREIAQAERSRFIAALQALRSMEHCTLLPIMRADFYPDLMSSDLWPVAASQRLEVAPLRGAALQRAIEQPATDAGVLLEARLVERLLADAADEPGVLPLLQETLALLWNAMQRRLVPFSAYKQLGRDGRSGLAVAIATKADAVLADLTRAQRTVARRIFLRLVQFGEGRPAARRQQPLAALRAAGDNLHVFGQTLRHLTDARLLTLSAGEHDADRKVDLAHEALIAGWPQLRQWVEERREAEQTRRRLETKVDEWLRLGQGHGGLLDEVELREVERWLASPDAIELGLSVALPELVEASRVALEEAENEKEAARQRELGALRKAAETERQRAETERRARVRQRQFIVGLSISFVVAIVLLAAAVWSSSIAFQQSNARATAEAQALAERDTRATAEAQALAERDATEQARRIALSRELAGSAISQLSVDPELALLLAMEAAKDWQTEQAKDALRQSLIESRVRIVMRGHTSSVSTSAFSPDGKLVVTASADHTARIWEASTGRMVAELRGHTESLQKAAVSRDGELIVTFAACDYYHRFCDTMPRIWNAKTGELVAELRRHTDGVYDAAFSPDSKYVITASRDHTALVWEARTGEVVTELRGHTDWVGSAAFSPDGKYIVTASRQLLIGTLNIVSVSGKDHSARVWDAMTGKLLFELKGHTAPVNNAVFSPAGKYIVTASADKTARLWEAQTGKFVAELSGHSGEIWSAAFSPNDKYIVTVSGRPDNTARLWDGETGQPLAILNGHTDFVWSAAFSPDSRLVVTTSYDHTARVWEVPSGRVVAVLRGHTAWINNAEFSPDSRSVVTASDDGTARIWKVVEGTIVVGLRGYTVKFNTTGERAISISDSNTASIWNTHTGTIVAELKVDSVWDASISPNGDLAVTTGSKDRKARVWEVATGKQIAEFSGEKYYDTFSAAFSPDGRLIVTADSVAVRVWDIGSRSLVVSIDGREGFANDAEFSPDGAFLVTASPDGTARLLDAQSGKLVGEFQVNAGPLYSAVFSTDGKYVLTAGLDQTVRVWDVQRRKLIAALLGHSQAVYRVVFSPNGRFIASASKDGTARVWETGTWRSLMELHDYGGSVQRVAFNPDGKSMATASKDGLLRTYACEACGSFEDLLPLAKTRVTRELTCEERQAYLHETTACPTPTPTPLS